MRALARISRAKPCSCAATGEMFHRAPAAIRTATNRPNCGRQITTGYVIRCRWQEMRFREFTLLARNLAEWTLIQAEIEAVDRAGAAGRFVDVYQHSVHLHVVLGDHESRG